MTTFIELLQLIEKSYSSNTGETEFDDINNDIAYWNNITVNHESKDERIEKAKETLSHIINCYLNRGHDTQNVTYSEYAEYLQEDRDPQEDEQQEYHQKNYLFKKIIEKINENDSTLPDLVVRMISFFDKVSKFPPEQQKIFLGQFPIFDKDLYKCAPGISNRLAMVMLQMDIKPIQVANDMVQAKTQKLLRYVENEAYEAHVPALLYHVLCGVRGDPHMMGVIEYFTAKDVWDFARNFTRDLNGDLAKEEINPNRKKVKDLKEAYNKYFGDKNSEEYESNIAKEIDLVSAIDGEDLKLAQAIFTEFLATECNALGDNQKVYDLFFECEEEKNEETKYVRKLKKDANGKPLLESKIEELVNLYGSIQTEEISTLESEDISNCNLYDEDMSQKIAGILTNPDSSNYQKHLAATALWIMAEKFQGNSLFNLIQTLYLIGKNDDNKQDAKSAIEAGVKFLGDLEQNPNIPESTKIFIGSVVDKNSVKNILDSKFVYAEGVSIEEGKISIKEDKLSIDHLIDLQCPAELTRLFTRETLVEGLLILGGDYVNSDDIAKVIFHHPKRNELLKALIVYANDEINIVEIRAEILLELVNISVGKGDTELLKEIMNETKTIFVEREIQKQLFLGNSQALIDRFDTKEIEFFLNSLKEEDDSLIDDYVATTTIFQTPDGRNGKFFLRAIEHGKSGIVAAILDSLSKEYITGLMQGRNFPFYNAVKTKNYRLVNVIIDKLQSKGFTTGDILSFVASDPKKADNSVFHLAVNSGNVTIVKNIFDLLKQKLKQEEIVDIIKLENSLGNTLLHLAVQNDNPEIIQYLFEQFTTEGLQEMMRVKNNEGNGLLHCAVLYTSSKAIKIIFEKIDADLITKMMLDENERKQSPFYLALLKGNLEYEKPIFEKLGKDNFMMLIGKKFQGHNVLHITACSQNHEAIEMILSNLDDENAKELIMDQVRDYHYTPLHVVIEINDIEATKLMLARLSKEDVKKFMGMKCGNNDSPMFYFAIESGSLEVTDLLLEKLDQEDFPEVIHMQDKNGNTPLHVAFGNGDKKAIKFIFDKLGSDGFKYMLMVKNKKNETPFHAAIKKGDADAIELILKNLNQEDTRNIVKGAISDDSMVFNYALNNAIHEENLEKIKFIIDILQDSTAEVLTKKNKLATDPISPLHYVVDDSSIIPEKISKIIEMMAEKLDGDSIERLMEMHYSDGSTLLRSLLAAVEFQKIDDLMLKKMTPEGFLKVIKMTNKSDGKTELHEALIEGRDDILSLIIEKLGTSKSLFEIINIPDNKGRTPFYMAVCSVNFDAIKLILRNLHKEDAERIVKDTISYDSVIFNATLEEAVRKNDLEVIKLFFDILGDDAKEVITTQNSSQSTLVYCAAVHNNQAAAKLMFEKLDEKDVNEIMMQKSRSGYAPLDIACRNGSPEIAALLLEKGGKINKSTIDEMFFLLSQNMVSNKKDFYSTDTNPNIWKRLYDTFTLLLIMDYDTTKEMMEQILKDNIVDERFKINDDAKKELKYMMQYCVDRERKYKLPKDNIPKETEMALQRSHDRCRKFIESVKEEDIDRRPKRSFIVLSEKNKGAVPRLKAENEERIKSKSI